MRSSLMRAWCNTRSKNKTPTRDDSFPPSSEAFRDCSARLLSEAALPLPFAKPLRSLTEGNPLTTLSTLCPNNPLKAGKVQLLYVLSVWTNPCRGGEMVNAGDLKSLVATLAGSTPALGTMGGPQEEEVGGTLWRGSSFIEAQKRPRSSSRCRPWWSSRFSC